MHAKSSLTLCDPMDCSLPGSSVHGIFQERMLEWVTTPPSRGSSPPRDQTHVSCISCMAGGFFTANTPREALWILVIVVQSLKSCPALGDHMDCSMVASPISWSFLKLMSIVLMITSYHHILCHLLLPSVFSTIRVFSSVSPSHQVAKVLELQLQRLSFQWIFKADFL